MRIQFSSNSKYVNFAINNEKNQRKNGTFAEFTAKKKEELPSLLLKRLKIVIIYILVYFWDKILKMKN
jgi:hypothetical protein